jgi:ATP-dependent Clp protease protease subunit
MKKFWKWESKKTVNKETNEEVEERMLIINGTIAAESWLDDDVTPKIFKEELLAGTGDVTVWINSPGGDCIAAAQIYTMLSQYKGNVTVKIDGLAASAASVIAMAGRKVLMSPVSMLMVHNPATWAAGDKTEFQKVIEMLNEVKESIINAYERKSNLGRTQLAHLMDEESWMNANKAVELGFADGILERKGVENNIEMPVVAEIYSKAYVTNCLKKKIVKLCNIPLVPKPEESIGTSVDRYLEELNRIKNHI